MDDTTVGRVRECTSDVLPHVALRDVRVSRMFCEGATPPIDGPFEVESNLTVSAKQHNHFLYCYAAYDVKASSGEDRAWTVKLEMVGSWAIENDAPEFDDEHLNCFAIAIGSMTLHPYARENVQTAVSRLGYPPFTLDMIVSPTAGADEEIIEISLSEAPTFSP